MDISWDDARLFLAIAETGSLSAAARRLNMTQPTVTRRLATLESALGEPLFSRGVAGATPTRFGESLRHPATQMAEWAAELSRTAERRATELEGTVRITAAPGFALDLLAPFAASLASEYPGICLEVIASVRYLDVGRREADLALRLQRPDQKELVVLTSRALLGRPFVAPTLAEALGPHPKIADVPWIAWAPPFEDTLPNPILAKLIPGFRPAFATDDFLVQLGAAQAGVGAIFLAQLQHRFSRPMPLVELKVQGIRPYETAIHLVASKSALSIPRVRLVADRLTEILAPPARRPRRSTSP
jgi:DNA-binding transcriptional LysR family regulator